MSPFNEIQSSISLEWRENRWPGALFRADYSGCDAGAGELDPSPLTLLDDCWSCSFCSMGSPEHHSGLIHTEASRQFPFFLWRVLSCHKERGFTPHCLTKKDIVIFYSCLVEGGCRERPLFSAYISDKDLILPLGPPLHWSWLSVRGD